MNCSGFETALNELADSRGRQLPPEATEHCQSCRACTQLWQEHCLLNAAVRLWRSVEVPLSLADGVLQNLRGESPRSSLDRIELEVVSKPQARSGRWAVAATAACLAMACLFAVRSGNVGHDRPAALSKSSSTPTNAVPVEVSESVVALLADLKAEYRGIADETTATARDLASVLPQSMTWPAPVLTNGDADESTSAPASEIGRSIGDQIGQAIGFLWQSVPSGEPSG